MKQRLPGRSAIFPPDPEFSGLSLTDFLTDDICPPQYEKNPASSGLTVFGNSVTIVLMEATPKIPNVLQLIRSRTHAGEFIILPHALERGSQRAIAVADIVYVLSTGNHESKKDQYKEEYRAWNYAIRGKTIDNRELRIAVSFDEEYMLVITVIRISSKRS